MEKHCDRRVNFLPVSLVFLTFVIVQIRSNHKEKEIFVETARNADAPFANFLIDLSSGLQVAWLMSFPNSGTTYTNHLIQGYTNTTTATNYGKEQSETATTIPAFPDSVGPYFRYPTWNKPSKYLLTKTHCAASTNYMPVLTIDTVDKFETTCSSGSRVEVHNRTATNELRICYNSTIVQRAVHVVRNPFDNIVARFHMKMNKWKGKVENGDEGFQPYLYNSTKEGFRAYCKFRNKPFHKLKWNVTLIFGSYTEQKAQLLKHLCDVPCYEQFIMYIRWHNFALQLLQERNISTLTLFYEDYASNFESTVDSLLEFLSLTPATNTSPPEFIAGKQYLDYYDANETIAVKQLIVGLASLELQKLLLRYLM
jgi:hypothetical protein